MRITNFSVDPATKKLTFYDSDLSSIQLSRLDLITYIPTGQKLFQFNSNGYGATVSKNVLTLQYDISALSSDPRTYKVIYNLDDKKTQGNLDSFIDSVSTEPIVDVYDKLVAGPYTGTNIVFLPATYCGGHEYASLEVIASNSFNILVQYSETGITGTWKNYDGISIGVQDVYSIPLKGSYIQAFRTSGGTGNVTGKLVLRPAPSPIVNADGSISTSPLLLRSSLVTGTAVTTSNNGSALVTKAYRELVAFLNVTSMTGAGTFTPRIELSDDQGATYPYNTTGAITDLTFGPVTAADVATTGKQRLVLTGFGDAIRGAYTISGGTPSVTFTLKIVGKS